MTTAEFLERWRHAGAAERANKDSFLVELCDVLGVERPHPKTNDPEKDVYVFEKDVARSREDGTSIGRIDLFRAGCFVLEAKQVDSAKRGTPGWEQAMNDALGKLRSGEELSAKERVIHEQGLVSVLKQIHDELDAAVFEAYGWPVTLTDEEILERLVALNHERAEEEKRGLVRWLRPEFQNPQGKKDAVQDEIPGTRQKKAKKGAKAAASATPARAENRVWPKDLPQQVAAVRDLLAETGSLDLAGAKAAFKGAKDDALAASLDSLAALGLAVASGAGPARNWSGVR